MSAAGCIVEVNGSSLSSDLDDESSKDCALLFYAEPSAASTAHKSMAQVARNDGQNTAAASICALNREVRGVAT